MTLLRVLVIACFAIVGFSAPTYAVDSFAVLEMTEIHPKVMTGGVEFSDTEYVELYNPSSVAISLNGYSLARCDTSTIALKMPDEPIQPHEYKIVKSSVALLDINGCVSFKAGAVELEKVSYGSEIKDAIMSLSKFIDGWKAAPMSPKKDSMLEVAPPIISLPLDITEIQAGPKGFIEIKNPNSASVTTNGYSLKIRQSTGEKIVAVPNTTLVSGQILAISASTSALKNGNSIELLTSNATIASKTTITQDLPLHCSWAVFEDGWRPTIEPTSGVKNTLVVPQTAEIQLSEIMANPDGDDTGKEWVELYNPNNTAIDLRGYVLQTGGKQVVLGSQIIEANSYITINVTTLGLTLTNTTDAVKLFHALGDVIAETSYQNAPTGEAWAYIDGEWSFTNQPTENAPNSKSASYGKGSVVAANVIESAAVPCPAGKFRNPETGRCKTIEADESVVKPCGDGEYRNPETGRCKKYLTSTASALKPCAADEFRNPETGRCKKTDSGAKELEPCKQGYERNPETNRCRKIVAVPAGTNGKAPFAVEKIGDSPQSSVGWWSLGILLGAGVLYGGWEWREELKRLVQKIIPSGGTA